MNRIVAEYFGSPKVQIASLLFTALYITGILFIEYSMHQYPEPLPNPLPLTPQEKHLATPVEVGLHINNFPEFSFNKNFFTLNGVVWFKFERGAEALDIIERFSFHDALLDQGGKIIHRSPPIVKLVNENHVLISYHVIARFRASLEHRKFPMDDHRLVLILQNQSISHREIFFVSSTENFTRSADIDVDNWTVAAQHVKTGYIQSSTDSHAQLSSITYPCTVFAIDFDSFGARNVISLYFPLFVIFFICLLSLTINIFNSSLRLGIVSTSLPILVLFRMVIEGVSPDVGYTTHIDRIFYILVLLSLLLLVIQVYIALESQKIEQFPDTDTVKQKTREQLEEINNITFFIILVLLMGAMSINFFC